MIAFGQAPNLGTSGSFALFTAAGAFSNGGSSIVKGDIGTNVGAFTDFPPGTVIGQIHTADAVSAQAATDVGLAYSQLVGLTCGGVIGTTLGAGQILTPKIYCLGAASSLTGDLILDGQGNPGSVFIFQIDGALSTSTLSRVILTNSASLCNVYWQVNGAFSLGQGATFVGTVVANGAINLLEGSSLDGRGLSREGAISMSNNAVTGAGASASVISAASTTTFCAGGSVILSGNKFGTWSNGSTAASITVTTGGDYYVTNSGLCESATSNHITVIVNPLPTASVITSGSTAICAGSSMVLSGNIGGTWSTGATSPTITVSTAGDYFVTNTNACGDVVSNHLIISINPLPTASVISSGGGVTAICVGSSVVLSGNSDGTWSTGATTPTITVTTAGDYFVTNTNTCGDAVSNHILVSINPLPICQITGAETVCSGQSTELCASGGSTYSWSTGASGSCISVNASGTYTVTVTDANGCISTCDKTISTSPLPIASVISAGGATAICAGTSVVLSGNSGGTWNNGATSPTITVTTAGDYSVTNTNTCGDVVSNHILISINPLPICQITGVETVCPGQTAELCASGGSSYLWSTSASTSCITVNATGTYTVTVTDANGCVSICSKAVAVGLETTCQITGNDAICAGQSTQLCVPAGSVGYLWSTGATTSCIFALTATTYSVTVTNVGGCTSICSKTISTSVAPVASVLTAGGATAICAGTSVVLSGNNGGTWSTGATTPSISVTTAGDYFVTNTNTCGDAVSNHILVSINPLPICQITGVETVCFGQSSELCASGGSTYLWSTGASTSCLTVNATGTYTVTVTDANGCKSTCSKTVTVGLEPTCQITGNDAICAGQSTPLCVPSGAAGYLWSTGATTSCIVALTATIYSVTVTNVGGCISICSKTISTSTSPVASVLTAGTTAICAGSSVVISGNSGGTWSTGATTPSITVTTAGDYFVTNSNACGDAVSNHILVNVDPLPICLITGSEAICPGQSAELCASGGSSYLWSTGASTSCLTVNATGTYTVTVTDANGCKSVCSKAVTVLVETTCQITGNGTICAGQSTQLCVPSGSAGYLWSTGATTNCIDVNRAGKYSVTITNGGCTSTCSKTIVVSKIAACQMTSSGSICPDQPTVFCVPSGAVSYLWNTGAKTNCIEVENEGTYAVTVTNANGCVSTCEKAITASEPLYCMITGNNSICEEGQSTELCVPAGSSSYLWSTGATTNCISISRAGSYFVTVTNSLGCTSTCSKTVTISTPANCLIAGNTFICEEGQITRLCAPEGAVSYLWSTGETTTCIDANKTGRYSVLATYAGGCISRCSTTVTLVSQINCLITGENTFCRGGQFTQLCAPVGALSYLWSTGEKTTCINAKSAKTYAVTLTYPGGCFIICSKTIKVDTQACVITGKDVICQDGQKVQLCAPLGAMDYWWSTGESTQCIEVSSVGTYAITLTNSVGCTSMCSKTISLSPAFNCDITGPSTICEGVTAQLCVTTKGVTYLWSNGSTTSCIDVVKQGTYAVTITNADGCTSTCSKMLRVAPVPKCEITGNLDICIGQTTQLCAPTNAGRYLWSNGSVNQCITVRKAGIYSVTITNSNGCKSTCSATVIISSPPECQVTGTFIINQGQSTRLCAPTGIANYLWSTGSTEQCIEVRKAGWYCVTLTSSIGCVSACSKTVTMVAGGIASDIALPSSNSFEPVASNISILIYPNPLTSTAKIEFLNTGPGAHLVIDLCTLTGLKIKTLFEGNVEQNVPYNTEVNAENLAGGVYYCRVLSGNQLINRKLIVIK
jgi:trimeric autotransporter adhesin